MSARKRFARVLFVFFLLVDVLFCLYPSIGANTYGVVGTNIRTDGTYLYMTMEDGVLPDIYNYYPVRAQTTIDVNSTIEGVDCLNISKPSGWSTFDSIVQINLTEDTSWNFNHGIMPGKYHLKFMVKEQNGGETLNIQLANDEGTPYNTYQLQFFFTILFGNNSFRVDDAGTVKYFSSMTFNYNEIYTLELRNITWGKKLATGYGSVCDVVLFNTTAMQTINSVDFGGTGVVGVGMYLPFSCIIVDSHSELNYFTMFFDDWTVGTQCNISDGVYSSEEENNVTASGTLLNDGSPLQNSTQSDHTVKILYDTASRDANASNYTYNASVTGLFANSSDTDAFTKLISTLTPGKIYYARTYVNTSYTNGSSYYYGNESYFLTKPEAPTNTTFTFINSTAINLSWDKGTGANNTIIVHKSTGMPSSISDGTVIYNSTGNYSILNITAGTSYYLRAWSYDVWTAPALYHFSDNHTDFSIGGLYINCFDESNFSNLTFNVSVINADGSETYNAYNAVNTHAINVSLCPHGLVSILINSSGYTSRLYYLTIETGVFYVLNAYLGGTASTNLYLLRVINELNQLQDSVSVDIRGYSNITSRYETVSVVYTDGAGECEVSLISSNLYKVVLSKTGYTTSVEDYIPDPVYYGLFYPKSFKIYSAAIAYYNESMYYESITFDGYLNNVTSILYVNYTDDLNLTINTNICIYKVNSTSNTTSYFSGTTQTTDPDYQYSVTVDDLSCCYVVVLYLNHTVFGFQTDSFTVCGNRPHMGITTGTKFNLLFNIVFGTSPAGIGWTNFFGFFVVVAGLFSFGQRDCGISCLLTGFILLFLNSVIGLSFMGVAIPILFIIVGFLVEWQTRTAMGGG